MNNVDGLYNSMFPRPCAAGEYIYVQGIEQVRNYPVIPGQTQRFMDVTGLLGYIKSQPYDPHAPYDLKIINMTIEDDPLTKQPAAQPMQNYVTMDQFNSLTEKIDKLLDWNEQKRYRDREGNRNGKSVRTEHAAE